MTDAPTEAGTGTATPRTRQLRRVIRADFERYGLIAAWVIAAAAFSILEPHTFPTVSNLETIFSSQTVLLCLTLALVLGLSAGEFDLSIGSLAGSVATFVAFMSLHHVPLWLILIAMLGFVALVGALHSVLVITVGVPSLVVTLGTGTLLIGLTIGIAGPQPLPLQYQSLSNLANARFIGLPLAWYVAFVLVLALYYLLEHTPLGRYTRFVGGSSEVARLAGIRVARIRVFALVGSSVLAGFAGLLLVGLQASSDINLSSSLLLPAFAGAFLGATAITPGKFNVWGAFAAVYFLVTGVTGLQLLGLAGWVEQVFYGASLIVAVAIGKLVSGKRANRAIGG